MTKRHSSIRLFVNGPLSEGTAVACDRAQSNYLRNVMRLTSGDVILVFDGVSGEWSASLEVEGKHSTMLNLREQVREQSEGPDIHYLFAPVKRARLDYMVQKAVELGVAALCPVITHRTEVSRVKRDRMHANVIEAAEQCGVLCIPQICEPVSLDRLLDGWNPDRRIIFCDEEADISSPLAVLKSIEPGPVAVLVGPEGGFDADERKRLRTLPFVTSLSLGPRIMRADTAAVAILSLVNAVLGDWH